MTFSFPALLSELELYGFELSFLLVEECIHGKFIEFPEKGLGKFETSDEAL